MATLRGAFTALVTPMHADSSVDYDGWRKLVKYQLENGIDGLVPLGTTAETPTLDENTEEDKIIEIVMEEVKSFEKKIGKKVPVVLGAGSNNTRDAVKYCERAKKAGADAALVVTPYYNKPSQKGMIAHFSAVAEAVNIPVILYNIPSRTGVNMTVETAKYLTEKYENIVAIKQSFGDLDIITDYKLALPSGVAIYSGDDSLTLPMLSVGVHGVISVASHLFGKEIKSMIRNFKTGDITTARNMHYHLYPAMKKLFMAPNPVPVKAALAKMGIIKEYVRKPLVCLSSEEKAELMKYI